MGKEKSGVAGVPGHRGRKNQVFPGRPISGEGRNGCCRGAHLVGRVETGDFGVITE